MLHTQYGSQYGAVVRINGPEEDKPSDVRLRRQIDRTRSRLLAMKEHVSRQRDQEKVEVARERRIYAHTARKASAVAVLKKRNKHRRRRTKERMVELRDARGKRRQEEQMATNLDFYDEQEWQLVNNQHFEETELISPPESGPLSIDIAARQMKMKKMLETSLAELKTQQNHLVKQQRIDEKLQKKHRKRMEEAQQRAEKRRKELRDKAMARRKAHADENPNNKGGESIVKRQIKACWEQSQVKGKEIAQKQSAAKQRKIELEHERQQKVKEDRYYEMQRRERILAAKRERQKDAMDRFGGPIAPTVREYQQQLLADWRQARVERRQKEHKEAEERQVHAELMKAIEDKVEAKVRHVSDKIARDDEQLGEKRRAKQEMLQRHKELKREELRVKAALKQLEHRVRIGELDIEDMDCADPAAIAALASALTESLRLQTATPMSTKPSGPGPSPSPPTARKSSTGGYTPKGRQRARAISVASPSAEPMRKEERKMKCGLCGEVFQQKNLPAAVSLSAIYRLWAKWGHAPPSLHETWGLSPLMPKPGRLYDSKRVCLFCYQFFDVAKGKPGEAVAAEEEPDSDMFGLDRHGRDGG